ncbi:MAG: type VI secretion system membrane subunit TssM [Kiloniellales bacterium]|nr:type VI secretion system membrane subunit TssM [Kiloniellales bacterium]
MRFLKACFGWLVSRTAISLYGIILLALLIWFVAPLVAIAGWEPFAAEDTRLVTICLIAFAWIGSRVWSFFRSRRMDSQIGEALLGTGEPEISPEMAASREEYEVLRQRFREALKTLKDTKLGGRGTRRLLYQLPWYVIIGPPGAGKTTALKNSGLRFPLMQAFGDAAIRGVGGTRNCDWWFTEDAVLLDTAGRYTTQDSDQMVDSSAWRNFLALLKKYRRRCPVNGVLVAVGVDDLTRGDRDTIRHHALAVRKRLQELTEDLKVSVPVYVIFTKCDLVAGFIEFFDDLGREGRGQVWGTTFPLARNAERGRPLDTFPQEFDRLIERLDERIFDRLGEERDLQRRGLILGFPQQMASIKASLQEFLNEAFQPSRYDQPGLLRGVYFTSGTQEGTPIDRAVSAMSGLFGLRREEMPARSGQGRSYFLTRLLQDVVFRESELVGRTGFMARYGSWVHRSAYAGGVLALAGLLGIWTTSYLSNEAHIADAAEQVTDYQRLAADSAPGDEAWDVLPQLDALRSLPNGYDQRGESPPLAMTFGLYQGDKLGDAANAAYRRGLNALLLTRLMRRLELQIADSPDNYDLLYTALKTYLMLADPKQLDPEFVALWFSVDWAARLPGETGLPFRDALSGHLSALLENELRPPPVNAALVTQARTILARRPLAERVYAQVKNSAAARKLETWRLADKAGPDAKVFAVASEGGPTDGIPGLFTAEGYKQVFRVKGPELASTAASERWVIGSGETALLDEAGLAVLTTEITAFYFEEYVRRWADYLDRIELARIGGFGQAIEVSRTLSGPTSPIVTLLTAIRRETDLSIAGQLPVDTGKISGRLQEMREQLEGLLGDTAPEAQALEIGDPANRVTQRFARLNALVEAEEGQPRPVDRVLGLIADLHFQLNTIDSSANRAEASKGLLSGSGSEIVQRVRNEAGRQPAPVDRWLRSLALQSVAVAAGSVRNQLDRAWREQIVRHCQEALGDRYPLAKGSRTDVNLDDFARFFGPGGRTDSFFKQYLAPFVDKSVRPWRPRAAGDARLEISPAALRQLEAADTIKEAFFPGGSDRPSITFLIKPVKLDEAVGQVVLELGDQRLTYRHGPPRQATMTWPPPSGSTVARIVFTPLIEAAPASYSAEGPWALFRLLDRGRLAPRSSADTFNLSFDIEGFEAAFQLQAGSVNNPFRRGLLEEFRCRERL